MKKLISVLLIALIMMLAAIPALASDYNFHLTVSTDVKGFKAGDTFTVKASVVDITDDYGLAVFDYSVVFDPSVIEFVSANVKLPAEWDAVLDSESGGVENLSGIYDDDPDDGLGAGIYRWVICVISENMGLKESNKLSLEITFKVLKDSVPAEINFVPGHSANDKFENMYGNAVTVTVENNVSVDEEESSESEVNVTVSGNYEVSVDETEAEGSESGDNNEDFPTWAIIVSVIAVIVVAFAVVYCVRISKKEKK